MKDPCIRCGSETEYEVSTPVTVRRYYVEGAGQLCEACFHILYPVPGALVTFCFGDESALLATPSLSTSEDE